MKILIMLLASFALFAGLASADPLIGCENYNQDLIRCWGNSSIEPVTFIAKNGTNFANNVTERFNWTSYEMGLFYNVSGVINKFPLVFDKNTLVYESDNLTYWRLTWYKNLSQGGKSINSSYVMTQSMTDDYVNMTFTATLWGFDTFAHDLNLYRWMKNIDIWNNNIVDFINVWHNEDLTTLRINRTGNRQIHNISKWLSIGSLNENESAMVGGIKWLFGEEYGAYYKEPSPGELNGEVAFYKGRPAPYPSGSTYSVTHQWIDADPCLVSCQLNCKLAIADNGTSGIWSLNQSGDYEDSFAWNCRWHTTACFFIPGCTLGNCYLTWVYKRDGFGTGFKKIETYPDYKRDVNCEQGSDCTRFNPAYNTWYSRTIYGIEPDIIPHYGDCAITEPQPSGENAINIIKHGTFRVWNISQSKNSNITLETPVNLYNATPGETINFECTRQDYWSDWLGLFLNDTLIYNLTSQGYANLSYSYRPASTGIYEWDCRAMYYGQAPNNWSWNGNYTFYYETLLGFPFIPLRDMDEESLLVYIVAGSIILLSGLFLFFFHRRTREYQDIEEFKANVRERTD